MADIAGLSERLAEYRTYMVRRGFARGVIAQRMSVARDWLGRHPTPAVATFRDVEHWLHDRNVQAVSERNLLVNLRALYHWLQREGLAGADPTRLVDRPRLPKRLPRPAADRDISALRRAGDVEMRAAIALMAGAGLRCCEASRLDWEDVDLAAGTVIVMGKGQRERLISLSVEVLRVLIELRVASSSAGPVFVGPHGRRRSPAAVSMWIRRAFRSLGLSTTAHQLRHWCATAALQLPDVDLTDVRDLLGHASVATTEGYTAVLPGRTARTSRAIVLPAA